MAHARIQVYAELDEQLQSDFADYLTERGVTPELGAYLLQLMHDKEQRWVVVRTFFVGVYCLAWFFGDDWMWEVVVWAAASQLPTRAACCGSGWCTE